MMGWIRLTVICLSGTAAYSPLLFKQRAPAGYPGANGRHLTEMFGCALLFPQKGGRFDFSNRT
ncbi:hypothetical protein [Anaerotruncus colihominis]|uniref:hypothetical protein n=1 Tax=Anaerotruncus colihominis TaxID=169435 RepID=UPI00189969D6|nr:hypothetical protein [Anaerotruncus colihominis]